MTTKVSPLSRALGYRKFESGAKPRLMVMKAEYFIVADVVDAAKRLGWQVYELETTLSERGDTEFVKHLLMAVVQFKPDFLLTINHIGFDKDGALAGLLDSYGIALASWFVDHPVTILGGAEQNAHGSTQVFCFERTALRWLEDAGFEQPVYLPTGSNSAVFEPARIDPKRAERLGRPLSLVANSWWQKARLSFSAKVHREAAALAGTQPGGSVGRAYLRDRLAEDLASMDRESQRQHVFATQAALAETSMGFRRDFAAAMAELGLVIFGDEHWSALVEDVTLMPPVDFHRDLPALFVGSRVNTNVTAAQMPTALNQRVWDVPAVGGFLLTDAQPDLFEYFEEGVDVVSFQDLDEAKDKARFYLANASAREKIAARARVKVDAEHRTHHRLERIEAVMRKRLA